jgi:hypothetical protein
MADKGFFIATLPHDGVVTFLALVREKELKPKRNGGVYLHLVLADRTGEVDAKVWDLCRTRHRSHYSDLGAMPSEVATITSVVFSRVTYAA